MDKIIRGHIIGKDKVGIPNLGVELWESDEKGKPTGTKSLLKSGTQIGGDFRIDLQRLPPDTELPPGTALVFRDLDGVEVGYIAVTSEAVEGRAIRYENSDLVAPKTLEIWPQDYSPLQQIPAALKDHLVLSPHEGLRIESTPEVSYFATYSYLPPLPEYWPWQVETWEIPPVEPLQQPFLIGMELTHRQEWHLLGHALGELLHSLPLVPGEETTIEILTWDRSVYKREEEFTSDMEREVEENRQFKDSREVLREIEKTKKWKVGGGFSLNLKIVKFNAGGSIQNEAKSLNRTTQQTIIETTDRASTKIRSQRKTSISSTRELGREEKVARKITNTNRCHTVTYHFYELLRNYNLLTSLSSVRPCIFVKQPPPVQRELLLADPYNYEMFRDALQWLHFNSHVISKGLLDRSLYKPLELIPDLLAYWMLRRGMAAPNVDLDPLIQPCVRKLVASVQTIKDAVYQFNPALFFFKTHIESCTPWVFPMVLDNEKSLKYLLQHPDPAEKNELIDAVKEFLATWNENYALIPQSCRNHIEADYFRKYLFDPVIRLQAEFTKLVYGPAPGEEPTPEQIARMRDVAEVVRLLRHIEQHFWHYSHLIWADRDADQRLLDASSLRLPGENIGYYLADVIENELLGFYVDYAIFPLKADFITDDSYLASVITEFDSLLQESSLESESVLPSNGIIVESQLGEYTACEPFIEQHRIHDLQLKELEVQKAEAENERRKKKIRNCELENPECCPTVKYGFFHRLFCWLRRGKEE